MRVPSSWLLLPIGMAVGFPSRAFAASGEWQASAKAGVGVLGGRPGPALDLRGAYGLSDMFDVVLDVYGSRHGGSAATDVFGATAGVAYKIDVFEWIPYVALLAGYYDYAGTRKGPNGEHGSLPGASVRVGLDYLVTRELALGAELGGHADVDHGFHAPLWSATLGAEYRWGF
jgi:hypothetical protein